MYFPLIFFKSSSSINLFSLFLYFCEEIEDYDIEYLIIFLYIMSLSMGQSKDLLNRVGFIVSFEIKFSFDTVGSVV